MFFGTIQIFITKKTKILCIQCFEKLLCFSNKKKKNNASFLKKSPFSIASCLIPIRIILKLKSLSVNKLFCNQIKSRPGSTSVFFLRFSYNLIILKKESSYRTSNLKSLPDRFLFTAMFTKPFHRRLTGVHTHN